ncbi:sugar-transfer associated ATP-grasp domain-containing protein [Rubrolithibacter danxiaensis]|uniref:sugar-transfer associated ATP-grasp domain-containing protein n=1 Tax=Rubrolithibacter danxiaensis TaxID=3390805 RepID=UPI003BF7D8AB
MNVNKARVKSMRFSEDFIYHLSCSLGRITHLIKLLKGQKQYIQAKSYFPEHPLKSKKQIFFEQLRHVLKYGEINNLYFISGFDRKGNPYAKDTISHSKLKYIRDKQNFVPNSCASPYNFICILRDKFTFGAFCKGIGIETPDNIALTDGIHIQLVEDKITLPIEKISELIIDAFCKAISGEQGTGTFALEIKDAKIYKNGSAISLGELKDLLTGNKWIIQKRLEDQHEALGCFHEQSVNTIRLITVHSGSSTEVIGAALRMGTGGSRVDNWNAGGIFVQIETETGKLKKHAFFKPKYGTKVEKHPDSDIVFEGYKLPFFKEAVDKAMYFHSLLSGIYSIGWDIAITAKGPVFIEGNDNWDVSFLEVISNGTKKCIEVLEKKS